MRLTTFAKLTALAAVAAAAAPAAGVARPPHQLTGRYAGTTSQYAGSARISFDVRPGHVGRIGFQWSAPCARSANILSTSVRLAGSVRLARGSFTANAVQPGFAVGHGYQARVVYSVSGRFVSARTLKGSLKVIAPVADPNGRRVDTCTTGAVRWTATRR